MIFVLIRYADGKRLGEIAANYCMLVQGFDRELLGELIRLEMLIELEVMIPLHNLHSFIVNEHHLRRLEY